MVRYLDMRLCMVVLINMVKSPKFQIGGGGVSWEVMTWSNLFTFVLVLSAFSFVSIEVPLTLTIFRTCSFHIRMRFGNRPLFAAALRCCFIHGFSHFPTSIVLAIIPIRIPNIPIDQVYDIFISAAVGGINEPHQQQQDDEPNSETSDLEANVEDDQ